MGDIFNFYSGSAVKLAGKGSHEIGDPKTYPNLPPTFRRVLSNFHVAPFVCHGLTYKSIEHYFQGTKVSLVDVTYGYKFCVESGDRIGLCDNGKEVKQYGGKKYVMLGKKERDSWAMMRGDVMKEAALAKCQQIVEYADILKATGKAELWHRGARIKPERFVHLEEIREKK